MNIQTVRCIMNKPGKAVITKVVILFVGLWVGLNGCAATPFTIENGNLYSKTMDFSTEIPRAGWHSIYFRGRDNLLHLHNKEFTNVRIIFEKYPHDLKLQHIKKNLSKDMALEKVAELFLKNKPFQPGVNDLKPISNGATQINGQPGYKSIFTYKDNNNLRIKMTFRFFFEKDSIYILSFAAPKRHYYDKFLSDFEKVVAHFQLGKSAAITNFKPDPSKEGDDY